MRRLTGAILPGRSSQPRSSSPPSTSWSAPALSPTRTSPRSAHKLSHVAFSFNVASGAWIRQGLLDPAGSP
eukprot:15439326-Alexandrium_andersonii.AAC.1